MSILGSIRNLFASNPAGSSTKAQSRVPYINLENPQDAYSFSTGKSGNIEEGNPLNKYKPNKKFKCAYDSYGSFWNSKTGKDTHVSPWKLHIYSDNKKDYHKLIDTIGPYLLDEGLSWKTTANDKKLEELTQSRLQKGKAFTIYPSSNQQMTKTAQDLDYIIRNNNLVINNSSITGDREMGTTGRIFYRYQYSSGAFKNSFFDMSTDYGCSAYDMNYDENRGENQYMAHDMTSDDDPWFNFDPSIRTSNAERESEENKTIKLEKNVPYRINGDETLTLAEFVKVDLSSPEISEKLSSLQDGDKYTIGRSQDSDFVSSVMTVSRKHAVIYKEDGKLYIKDTSLNGTDINKK